MNAECDRICKEFSHDGLQSVILIGQSNLIYYPEELKDCRTPGNIDLWCDVPEGIGIEPHYRPSYLNSHIRNYRLQRWFRENEPWGVCDAKIDGHIFPILPISTNVVYQLLHIYKHLFEEGIGLRQLLNYYFVLQTVFAMPDEYLICKPNEKEGKFLLNEIMMAGNFGKYDERIKRETPSIPRPLWLPCIGEKRARGKKVPRQLWHAWEKLKHNMRLVKHYPEEVMWEPFFRVYHWIWRRLELWKTL